MAKQDTKELLLKGAQSSLFQMGRLIREEAATENSFSPMASMAQVLPITDQGVFY